MLFVEVPCLDCHYKTVFDPHLQFFEKKTLFKCLSDAGFVNCKLSYHGDKVKSLRLYQLCKKIIVKFYRILGLRLFWLFKKSMPCRELYGLTEDEATAVYVTCPHLEHKRHSRWLRAFAVK